MDGHDDHANAHTAQKTVAVASGLYSVPYQSNCEQNTFDEQFGAAARVDNQNNGCTATVWSANTFPPMELQSLHVRGVRKCVVDL